jgi:hypothetical protein
MKTFQVRCCFFVHIPNWRTLNDDTNRLLLLFLFLLISFISCTSLKIIFVIAEQNRTGILPEGGDRDRSSKRRIKENHDDE